MTEEEYRLFIERQRWMGKNYVRKCAARAAVDLGLASYDDWMRDYEFERDLSNFRARWILAAPIMRHPNYVPIAV